MDEIFKGWLKIIDDYVVPFLRTKNGMYIVCSVIFVFLAFILWTVGNKINRKEVAHMPTPQDRIIEQLESKIERLNLEVDDLKEELRISKNMLEDITGELHNTHPNQGE